MAQVQRRLILLVLPVVLGGCSSLSACGRDPLPARFYDPELLPFLDEFMEDAFSRGVATVLDPELLVMKYVPGNFEDNGARLDRDKLLIGICATFDSYIEDVVAMPGDYPHLTRKEEGAWQELWILDKDPDKPLHGWDYWDSRILLYHELGHCLLGLGHKDNTIMDPTPVHVVKKGRFPGEEMSALWLRAVDELMHQAKEAGL